jgi:hypothetical protein
MADSKQPRKKGKSYASRHAGETPEERRARLDKRALSRKAKLAIESATDRELRLLKQRERHRKTRTCLSSEQKTKQASRRKAYYAANRDQILAKQKQYVADNKEARLAAGREYWRANREKLLAKSKLYREANKEAISVRRKEKYQQEKEVVKQKQRDYRKRDPQRYRENHNRVQKEWRVKNKDRVRAIYNRHMKKKRSSDVLFWLKCAVRERMCCALRKQSSAKSDRTIVLVGCTVSQLRRHLESLFLPGMTWANRGIHGWHIDHIIPVSRFDLSDPAQQAAAFHYTNLQPLWAKDNRRKSNKVAGQQCFGFAYAARIADAAAAKPKRRRNHGGQHGGD